MSTGTWTKEAVDAVNARRGRTTERAEIAAPKPSKYRNVKVVVDGRKFDSKKEAEHYLVLKAREAAGEIFGVECQRPFTIYLPDLTKPGPYEALCSLCEYRSDFSFRDGNDTLHVQDVKSHATRTAVYMLKKRALMLQYGIDIEEI
jgi:hypothetical protein